MRANDRAMVDLECGLTIGFRMGRGCECARYFIDRRDVLIPEVLAEAERRHLDAVDLFAAYARGVHRRHEAGLSLAVAA